MDDIDDWASNARKIDTFIGRQNRQNRPNRQGNNRSEGRRKRGRRRRGRRRKKSREQRNVEEPVRTPTSDSEEDEGEIETHRRRKSSRKSGRKEKRRSEPRKFSDLFVDLQRSRHNNIHLSKPYLKQIKAITKPKDMYISNEFLDEDISHEVQSGAVRSLTNYHTLVEKLKLLDGWVEHGNYDYPSLLLILSHLKSTLKEACFFRILQRRQTILEMYIHHLEQQLEHSKLYFTHLKNLYTFLGREDDKIYLQLRYAVYEQRKRRFEDVEKRYIHDIQNFTKTLNRIDEVQKKESLEEKKGIQKKMREDEEQMTASEERRLEKYDSESQEEREKMKKQARIEFINHLADDQVKPATGVKWEKEKTEIGMYINLIDREKQIEVLDKEYNMTQEEHRAFLRQKAKEEERLRKEKEEGEGGGKKRRRGRRRRRRRNKPEEEEEDVIETNPISKLDPFGKEFLFKEYPRRCIYNLNCSEFFKYLLFYHFKAAGGIVSPNVNKKMFNLSLKRYSMLALDARSKVGDWGSVSEAVKEAAKGAGKGSNLVSPLTGIDYGSLLGIGNKQSGMILPVETVLEVVSRHCPPRYVMDQILQIETEAERRFIHAKNYQCFRVAVQAAEELPMEVRVDRLKSLKNHIITLYGRELVESHPLMNDINYYILGGKVKKKGRKKKSKSWLPTSLSNGFSGLSAPPEDSNL